VTCLAAGRLLVANGNAAEAEPHITRGQELAEQLSASRFKLFELIDVPRIRYTRGEHSDETVRELTRLREVARQARLKALLTAIQQALDAIIESSGY